MLCEQLHHVLLGIEQEERGVSGAVVPRDGLDDLDALRP
jgi:hypothetical protein